MPKFSLIMPTFNRIDTITIAIDSIIACNYNDYELIIVDDGSTDNTRQLVETKYHIQIKTGQIKYYYSKGRHGVSFCRNIGLKLSSNDWIGYVDSDNKVLPNYFECFTRGILENPEIKMFYGQYVTKSGKMGKSREYTTNSLKSGNYIDLGVFIHNRDLYLEYGGFDEKLKRLVDWDLLLTYSECNNLVFLNSVIMEYNDDERADRITKKESMSLACAKISTKHTLNLPKVSTIILTYNHEKYLSQAIESAIAQDGYFIHEILISDDCSTDSTKYIIEKYCCDYPELITNISEQNHLGISNNYLKCFTNSSGEYVAILEGDDYWIDRLKLINQLKYLEKYPACNLVVSNIMLLKNGILEYQPLQGKISKNKLNISDFFKYNLNPIINFSCCMFRGNFVKNLPRGVFEYRLSEITLGMMCAEHSFVGYIPKIQSVYRVHENGVWSGLDKMDKLYSAYSVRYVASKCVSKKTKKLILSHLYNEYLTNTSFSNYLKERESITDFKKYLSENYGWDIKLYSRINAIKQKITKTPKTAKKTLSDLNTYENEILKILKSDDLHASVILMFLSLSEGNTNQSVEKMFSEMLNQHHTSKEYMSIARAYRDGNILAKNIGQSIKWMTLATKEGNKWARIELISLLMSSPNQTDNENAYKMAIEISLDQNDVHRKDALIRLSRMYSKGIGTPINLKKATEIYLSLINIEEKIIPEFVNLLYNNSKILSEEVVEPLKVILLKKECHIYAAKISLILARYYMSIKDLKQSECYFDQSIDLGNEWAIIEKISYLMSNEIKNGKAALIICEEYLKKPNINYPGHAYLRMARLYRGVFGVEPNSTLSKQYYQKAIEYGIDISNKELESIGVA